MRALAWGIPVFLVGLLAQVHWAGAEAAQADPGEVGLSSVRLQALTRHLESEVDAGRIAGAVGLIARHGRVAYLESVGMADRENGIAMRDDTLFRIASMTKAITSTAVMMLVEEGTLSLNDPLARWIPEFSDPRVLDGDGTREALRHVTIHHLLTHTSGIGYGWFGPVDQDEAYREAGIPDVLIPVGETLQERVSKLAPMPLAFQPGSQWSYGLSIDVLGRVIEIASGLSLDQFFRERIFRPLGMADTHFYVPPRKLDRLAALYTPTADRSSLEPVGKEVREAGPVRFSADFCYPDSGRLLAGGSGLVSTATDYALFLQMLLNDGRPLLDPSTVRLMTSNRIGDLRIPFPGHGDGFGYGFGVLTERGRSDEGPNVGIFSWGGIFNTYYWVDPQEEMIGILMTQVFPYDHLDLRTQFRKLSYQAIDDSGFYRTYWYEQGLEHGNPYFNGRQLRVNAPEASIHESFHRRSEPRSSGLARILIEEDLRAVRRADLYCEIWGGHPGTANRRVGINGRNLLFLPAVDLTAHHCTHGYPRFNLRPSDLVNGYNSLQFACDQGDTFWGHFIVDNACLQIGLDAGAAGFPGFNASVKARPQPGNQSIRLELSASHPEAIASVHYEGHYHGYDENGNGRQADWHGMTHSRDPYAILGSVTQAPFQFDWDTAMLPRQPEVSVRAVVRFRDTPDIFYRTPVLAGIAAIDNPVSIHSVSDLPEPFWSRAGRVVRASIDLPMDPSTVERAELHVVTWTGGAGTIDDYFTLNGRRFPVAEGSSHAVHYARMPMDPSLLRQGGNEIVLHSDTDHHGIEILYPGPAIVVRSRR